MERHINVLGALFLGLGILGTVGMLVVLAIFGLGSGILFAVSAQAPDMPGFVRWLPALFGFIITAVIAVTTVPCYLAGYGLLKVRHWGRMAALIAGILNLVAFPLGTAVGIYTFWVFLQEDTDQILGQ